MTTLRLATLGELRSWHGEQELLPGRRKELALLVYLACRAPGAVSRAELVALFWGSKRESRARQSLRQALHALRVALPPAALEITPAAVRVHPEGLELDVAQLEAALSEGDLAGALARWRGEFLPALEEVGSAGFRVWLEVERERLRHRVTAALDELLTAAEARGDWSAAVSWAERWTQIDRLSEPAHTHLIHALRLAGRAGEAGALHAAFVARHRSELGSEPSAEFLLLARAAVRERAKNRLFIAPHSSALFSPDLVGRGTSFAQLVERWQAVVEGAAAVLLVKGEEGIGKTRLCEEFLRWIGESGGGAFVLRTRAYEAERELTYSSARDLLAGMEAAPGLSGASTDALAQVAQLVPAIRGRFPRLPEVHGNESPLLEGVRRVLADVAAETPVLLFLDDFHDADEATQRLLLSLARRPPSSLFLLLTARTDADHAPAALEPLWELPHLRTLPLPRLSAAEVESLLDSMLVLPPEQRRALALRLHAEGDGIPVYVIALVSALADAGQLAPDAHGVWQLTATGADGALPLPPDIRATVRARLEHLSAAAREVLETVAVSTASIDAERLEAATGQSSPEFCDAVDELIARRFLREARESSRGYEFTHELIRRVVHERIGPARRQLLRRRLAAATAARAAGEPGYSSTATARRHRTSRSRPERLGLVLSGSALALVLLLALVAVSGLRPPERPEPPSSSAARVAVLPFTVQGSPGYAYLGVGMVDLLSIRLEGAGELTSVESRALLAATRAGLAADDPALARHVAQRSSAGLFVLGSVTEVGGRLQLNASLYDASGELRRTAQTGPAEESRLFELVDDLARQLLVGVHGGPAAPLAAPVARP